VAIIDVKLAILLTVMIAKAMSTLVMNVPVAITGMVLLANFAVFYIPNVLSVVMKMEPPLLMKDGATSAEMMA